MKDQDGDGYGDINPSVSGVTPGTDCNDGNGDTYPSSDITDCDPGQGTGGTTGGGEEPLDCSDVVNVDNPACVDDDEDGFTADEDCDDTDPNTYPGVAEFDSVTDCMKDSDGDGYGDDGTTVRLGVNLYRL